MPQFDRFDILEAYHLYFTYWHAGAGSTEYRRHCKMLDYFRPAHGLDLNTLSENGLLIYNLLVARTQFPDLEGELVSAIYGLLDLGHQPRVEPWTSKLPKLECGCGSVVYIPCEWASD